MKKILGIIALSLTLSINALADNDRVTNNVSELPAAARTWLNKHYAGAKVKTITIDKELARTEGYEVRLADGTEIDFNAKGNWKEIDAKRNAVPARFVPKGIGQKVSKLYPGKKITKISKETRGGFDIELSDGTELEFNKNFKLKEVDR